MKRLSTVLAGTALAFCAAGAAHATTLSATLNGTSETRGGDPNGSGRFTAEADEATGDLCYVLAVKNISPVTAAHIHQGAAGQDGPPVVTIEVTGPDADLCMAVEPDTLKPILADPSGYYVNVHTADFPAGAVRGQLAGPAAE